MSTGVDTPISKHALPTIKNVLLVLDAALPKTYESKTVDATIQNAKGEVIFSLKGVEAPVQWNQVSINIAAEKYFAKGEHPEKSVFTMVSRVATEIGRSAVKYRYIEDADEVLFIDVMCRLLLGQYYCFNSPVWFNVGVHENPRISACFILGIEDTMESILENAKVEGMIYKYGSGSGINYSNLRGRNERLSHGGVSSGVLSFIDIGDAVAGSIKSGGTTRRAAKMVILNCDHPDIEEFVEAKVKEEEKARALIKAGYSAEFNNEQGAYATVGFQNANHTVRVTDEFMKAVEEGEQWALMGRVKSTEPRMVEARDLFKKIAAAAWRCGDPGLQFDTTINAWNSLRADGRINSSNPCSEYMSLDNTSCNLASINLMKFRKGGAHGDFNYDLFNAVSFIGTVALDVLICDASYPTEMITKNVLRYRQIGLGYANLGALLMSYGLPYDSEEGRMLAAGITASMTASSCLASVEMARIVGPFEAYERNRNSVEAVIIGHLTNAANRAITNGTHVSGFSIAHNLFMEVIDNMRLHGIRNSYFTNLAPTGTIGLLMGCDTTGIEPELALIKYKKLVGGGMTKIVNQSVPLALKSLGYKEKVIPEMVKYLHEHGHFQEYNGTLDCLNILPEEVPVFATSIGEKNVIHWSGHIKMMAAVQPFLSGSISKTVNMPNSATVEDVELAYKMAWQNQLKCVAIYRDGCKDSQPLNLSLDTKDGSKAGATPQAMGRMKLPNDRPSITHKFAIGGHEGYINVGMYEDGRPGELFLTVSKEGSFVGGLLDSFATMVSIALQYGAPIKLIAEKLKGHSYEPQGITNNPDIRFAKSLSDYIGRYLEQRFVNPKVEVKKDGDKTITATISMHTPPCPECGGLTAQSGSCHVCQSCGTTTGCS